MGGANEAKRLTNSASHGLGARAIVEGDVQEYKAMKVFPWPSAMARSISPQELVGWWREDLDPRRHITAERSNEKVSLHLSQLMVLLYGLLYFSAIRDAILL